MNKILYIPVLLLMVACGQTQVPDSALEKYVQAKNLYIKGDTDGALVMFEAVKKSTPDFVNNLFMIGKIRFMKKDYPGAIIEFNAALSKNPEHGESIKWLARAYLVSNESEKAEQLLEKAAVNFGDEPDFCVLMGKVKKQKKDFSAALDYYKRALLSTDLLRDAHIDTAEIYRSFGLPAQSIAELEKALVMTDTSDPVHASLVQLIKGMKQ